MKSLTFSELLLLIRGAGDVASGVALRLHRAGFPIVMTEISRPTCLRRTVSFAQAVYGGETEVEGLVAERAGPFNFMDVIKAGRIPVLPDAAPDFADTIRPAALVEATLAKKNTHGLRRQKGRVTIALGPGYEAGRDADAVVETQRGHFLGRVILEGRALPDTGLPSPVEGFALERLIKSPAAGRVEFFAEIGQMVEAGQILGRIIGPASETPIAGAISGCLRGAVHNGLTVPENFKIGDIDPRPISSSYIHSASDKARAIGGGVLEALLYFFSR